MALPLNIGLQAIPDDGAGFDSKHMERDERNGTYNVDANVGDYLIEAYIRPMYGVSVSKWTARITVSSDESGPIEVLIPEWSTLSMRRPVDAGPLGLELKRGHSIVGTWLEPGVSEIAGFEPGEWRYRLTDSKTNTLLESGMVTLRSGETTILETQK